MVNGGNDLKPRTKKFALDVILFSRKLPRTDEFIIIKRQLIRSATSTAANYRSAQRAKSTADFIHKLGTAEGEPAGPGRLSFPVPWASVPDHSHLVPGSDVVRAIEAAGFEVVHEDDPTDQAPGFFAERLAAGPPPPLSLLVLMGDALPERMGNIRAGFEEGAVRLLRLVARRRT